MWCRSVYAICWYTGVANAAKGTPELNVIYPPLPCCMCVWCYMIGSEATDVVCVNTLALVNHVYSPSMILRWCDWEFVQ